jgi:hypothetical protein
MAKFLTEKNFQGAYVCSTIINGVREHMIYMGYTKRYAQTLFRQHLKTLNENA